MKTILIIFDLNGTLLSRLTHKPEILAARANPFCPTPDFAVPNGHVYVRPNFYPFVQELFLLKNVKVAVWTSAQPKNSHLLTKRLFKGKVQKLRFVLHRIHCEQAPKGIKVATAIKNLNLIFKSLELSEGGLWTEHNTILIDDSPSKCRLNPLNLIEAPSFDYATGQDYRNDSFLPDLLKWLKFMDENFDESSDVRDEIIKSGFRRGAPI